MSSPVTISSRWEETPTACERTSSIAAAARPYGEAEGELLIGADGIHSVARGILYPDEGPPIWNGAILWRGVTHGPPFLTGRTMIMAGHEVQKFVCYPIARARERGEALINWIAERKFRRRNSGDVRTGTGQASSTISCRGSTIGASTGSTCQRSSEAPSAATNTRWSIAIRSSAGPSAA